MSATNQLLFEEAFEKLLPTELKHMIFKFATTDEDNTNELHVKLAADQASSPTLQSSAIALLGNLKKHKSMATMYDQALQYLTDPTFRWVFISDAQPYRFLLVAFRNQVPLEIRERIKHVYLPKVSVEGLVDPATLPQVRSIRWGGSCCCRQPLDILRTFSASTRTNRRTLRR
jgi:hypothetical protein